MNSKISEMILGTVIINGFWYYYAYKIQEISTFRAQLFKNFKTSGLLMDKSIICEYCGKRHSYHSCQALIHKIYRNQYYLTKDALVTIKTIADYDATTQKPIDD